MSFVTRDFQDPVALRYKWHKVGEKYEVVVTLSLGRMLVIVEFGLFYVNYVLPYSLLITERVDGGTVFSRLS